MSALTALGLPREQRNERSALTLLCLLDLKPATPWSQAANPARGITPILEFIAKHYGRKYAPNTRETVRRFTVHQFEQAGLVVRNPDMPRPVNSPDNVYQVAQEALELLRALGGPRWDEALAAYLATHTTLRERYAARRRMQRVPVTTPGGRKVQLSPGGHNVLIKEVIEQFCARYAPGGELLYVGEAGNKFALWEPARLARLGVVVDEHGKMPDVVVFHRARGWLLLIEAVTSHGPVNPKRHAELKELFRNANVPLVFVSAFLTREAMRKFLPDISWETEVWIAEAPTHLIHFNGERFLGPHAPT